MNQAPRWYLLLVPILPCSRPQVLLEMLDLLHPHQPRRDDRQRLHERDSPLSVGGVAWQRLEQLRRKIRGELPLQLLFATEPVPETLALDRRLSLPLSQTTAGCAGATGWLWS